MLLRLPPSPSLVPRLLTGVLLVGAPGCDDVCEPGQPCECAQTTDCYLKCTEPGCDLWVHNLLHGGGICEDSCHQLCHDVTDCSLSCGDACVSQAHHTTSSGTLCGARCDHECHDMDRCGVVAGAESHVNCHNLTTCEMEVGPASLAECHSVESCGVTCTGPCRVEYSSVSGGPLVTCPAEAPRTECSSTVVACGPC